MIQGSRDWYEARVGKLTASRMGDATGRTLKGAWRASRADLMAELVAERMTGETASHYVSDAMKWGIAQQPAAEQAYAFLTGREVAEGSYWPHPRIKDSGASPDGLIGPDGGLEIKCPITETHIATLIASLDAPGYVPPEHLPQVHWGMACTGRAWWDFVSYDPRMPAHLQVYVARVERDNEVIAKLEKDAAAFLAELAAKVERLHLMFSPPAEAAA